MKECLCSQENVIPSSSSIEFESKYLEVIKIDGMKWKTLYKCRICGSFWEERDLNGRFGVDVELVQVSEEYVKKEWFIE